MDASTTARLRVGDWCLDTAAGELVRQGETVRLDARTLRLLLCLTGRAGHTVSADDLLSHVWPGVVVTPDSVYQAIAGLRRLLGDDPKQPTYVVTVPRQGYRLVAEVAPWQEAPCVAPAVAPAVAEASASPFRFTRTMAAALAVAVVLLCIGVWAQLASAGRLPAVGAAPPSRNAIAVLPFLDLTEGMGSEIFADGMAEELIDRLSKIPGYRVPSPASSFYFKGRHVPVADIGRQLGVRYVLGGSVRKSGTTLRVAARLIQADNGFIVWSETYDRPGDDLLKVQGEIAAAVAGALPAALQENRPAGQAQGG